MLMAAMHMDSSSSSTTTTTPWLPVLAGHRHQNKLLHDLSASTHPSPSPPSSHHHHLLPPRAAPSSSARNRITKRRPRPSRRLPTTYISADAASFRRMVHQVTGADDLPPQPSRAAGDLLITGPAPISKLSRTGTEMLLPTLDTSAFLVGALSRTATDAAPRCDASSAASPALEAGGPCCKSSPGGGGFPTLESWDHHAPLF